MAEMMRFLDRRRPLVGLGVLSAISLVWACSSSSGGDPPPTVDAGTDAGIEPGAELLGGETTIVDSTSNAFTFAARNLDDDARGAFALGDHFFNRNWVTAPASASGNDGLGPTFNATSCSACHFKDGPGRPPTSNDEKFLGLLIRLSIPGQDAHGGPLDEPNYGGQFNHQAILNVPSEGTSSVSYVEVPGTYADGEAYSLRRPEYKLEGAFGPFASSMMTSPRVAPAMIGLGLLQAISEETLSALADENDRDGDGISGRPNHVWNIRAQKATVGRFGWKANQPTIEQQSAGAFQGDIGITSELDPNENCPAAQTACKAAPSGGTPTDGGPHEPELSNQKLDAVTRYGMTVAVPARRNWTDPVVREGEQALAQAKCTSCHVAKVRTGVLDGYPALSNQTIRPFTDLLLHDMGPELADGRPDFEATGTEWRTSPLWGIGLTQVVSRHSFFLHDGRARGFAEAILWHGGEAAASREAFRTMPKVQREALIKFLESL
ncbi:thiol oxidoreductase [Pendulispora rubella]|uniref:Thiol oxidoreductase n=1 Tax=Pendulispora rubella TaxID=2741070 RepID=A0ABZ2LAF6_9BACT